jgi:hypothetical protein
MVHSLTVNSIRFSSRFLTSLKMIRRNSLPAQRRSRFSARSAHRVIAECVTATENAMQAILLAKQSKKALKPVAEMFNCSNEMLEQLQKSKETPNLKELKKNIYNAIDELTAGFPPTHLQEVFPLFFAFRSCIRC